MKHIVLNTSVLLAVACIGLLGVYAGFVDTEVSRDNTVEAGALDLMLSNGEPSNLGHGVQNTWVIPEASPHDSVSRTVHLTNFGTLGEHLDIQSESTNAWTIDPPPAEPPPPKDAVLIVTAITYAAGTPYEQTIVWVDDIQWPAVGGYHFDPARITDFNGDGLISLDELEQQKIQFTPAPVSGSLDFLMAVQFEPQFGPYPADDYENVETNTTIIFSLE
ncbi:MAG: hypothetical protein DRI40_01690 [Chloroflexi bacterium]|mgnify:CR=1 FL=1|nr:MAG: hypothetical protein DRI40_01690 [Chloroflexota bacterium]